MVVEKADAVKTNKPMLDIKTTVFQHYLVPLGLKLLMGIQLNIEITGIPTY